MTISGTWVIRRDDYRRSTWPLSRTSESESPRMKRIAEIALHGTATSVTTMRVSATTDGST